MQDEVQANIERMEVAVRLPSPPWPQHPWRRARAIENRLSRVRAAAPHPTTGAVERAVAASHAWAEALPGAAATPVLPVPAAADAAEASPESSPAMSTAAAPHQPWLLYGAVSLGIVGFLATAVRSRNTMPGTIGRTMKLRAEAAVARERRQSELRILRQSTNVGASDATGASLPQPPRWAARKWRKAAWAQPHTPGEAYKPPSSARTPTGPAARSASPAAGSASSSAAASSSSSSSSSSSPLIAGLNALPARAARKVEVATPLKKAGAHSQPRGGNHEVVLPPGR
jgi:hypothetical protein